MSRSELHNWECTIEKLSGDNADKMLAIAQDIYNTAFAHGKNYRLEEHPKWIPVSERLPEEEGDYLLMGKIDESEEEHQFIGHYDSGCEQFGEWWEQFDQSTLGCIGSEFSEYASVIAWMPLPEPYVPDINVGKMAESEV